MTCPEEYLAFFRKALDFSDKSSFVLPMPRVCRYYIYRECERLGVDVKSKSLVSNSLIFTRGKKSVIMYYSPVEDIKQYELGNDYLNHVYKRFSTSNQAGNAPFLEPKAQEDL